MSIEQYLNPNHQPNALPAFDLLNQAYEELALPMPSTKLTNFPMLTEMTGGLRPREFTILCGSTGSGKTTLCANLSLDLLQQNVPQFVASVETGHTDYLKRMISAKVGVDWNTGDAINPDHLARFHQEWGGVFSSNRFWLSLYENRFSVETLMAEIAWMVKHHGIKVATVDNLNFFMEVTSANEAVKEMDRVIHELIIFCKRIDVHLIMVMHL